MRFVASLIAVLTSLAVSQVATAEARSGSPRLDPGERSLIRAINGQRRANGLRKVRAAAGLSRAADFHSKEMLAGDYFAHPSRNGGAFDRRIRRFARGRAVGETLAMMSSCRGMSGTVIGMWMNSPSHRAIILSPSFRRVGVGRRSGRLGGGRACMVTADFASRR
ncbi:MAG: hypothetical protein QOF17_1189 [Solirubrobacteraceae bacterium]|jgi:uncharacterized protein YkwD|nr:hypothetical protein [Solirubrobacteraceae bacterium]